MIANRDFILDKIRSNIKASGCHIHLVKGGASPRFAYTIGISEKVQFEFILAGALFYNDSQVSNILNIVAEKVKEKTDWQELCLEIDSLGFFSFQPVDISWCKKMMLGALDFYNTAEIATLQIIPDQSHWTMDIPDMTQPWDRSIEPAWQWLNDEWNYPVPKSSTVVTNIDVLRGQLVTEAMRWEDDQWELFAGAGPDVPKEDIREVSLGTLLGLDESLKVVTSLEVGKGFWRDINELEWRAWG